MRKWIVDRKEFDIEERKDIYAKKWGVESRDNPVAS